MNYFIVIDKRDQYIRGIFTTEFRAKCFIQHCQSNRLKIVIKKGPTQNDNFHSVFEENFILYCIVEVDLHCGDKQIKYLTDDFEKICDYTISPSNNICCNYYWYEVNVNCEYKLNSPYYEKMQVPNFYQQLIDSHIEINESKRLQNLKYGNILIKKYKLRLKEWKKWLNEQNEIKETQN